MLLYTRMNEMPTNPAATPTTSATPAAISAADIADAAVNPSSFSVEGLSQTNRPISDYITADKYLRKLRRSRCHRHPLDGMVSHMIPPGTCDR